MAKEELRGGGSEFCSPDTNGERATERVGCVERKRIVRADGGKMARKERGRNEMPRAIGKFRGHAKMIRPRRSVCAKVRRR
jgi:hypothetical protein